MFYNYYKLWISIRIGIFSGTDMIKIWNWFKAIGSFVRIIKEKNTSADLSNWGAELSGSQALGYTLWFSLFSLKLNMFPFSASILTFSTQNHIILKYFTNFDTTHFYYYKWVVSKFVKYLNIRWFCVEKVR